MDAGKQTKQGALAGSIGADDADGFACINVQRDVSQRPELFDPFALRRVKHAKESLFEGSGAVVAEQKSLGQPCGFDHPRHQTSSAKRSSLVTNIDAPSTNMPVP